MVLVVVALVSSWPAGVVVSAVLFVPWRLVAAVISVREVRPIRTNHLEFECPYDSNTDFPDAVSPTRPVRPVSAISCTVPDESHEDHFHSNNTRRMRYSLHRQMLRMRVVVISFGHGSGGSMLDVSSWMVIHHLHYHWW